jgi:hypothetical protein
MQNLHYQRETHNGLFSAPPLGFIDDKGAGQGQAKV